MNFYKNILSYLLLSIYVLSIAHGAIPHNHDSNHHHEEHSHEHAHDHDDHEGNNHLIQATHGLFHSVIHFIENLSHSHDASNEPIIVESTNLSHQVCSATITVSGKEALIEYSPKAFYLENKRRYSKIYLINSSLRGPPSIV